MSHCTMSTYLLITSRDGDSTTALDRLFQCLTTLLVKKFLLISNLNLPWHNLRLFPLVLVTCYLGKDTDPHFATTSFQVVVESDKVPLSLLFSKLNNPRSLSHSSQDLCSQFFTSFVALFGHAPASQCSCSEMPSLVGSLTSCVIFHTLQEPPRQVTEC